MLPSSSGNPTPTVTVPLPTTSLPGPPPIDLRFNLCPVTLFYGDTNTWKTTQIALWAMWVYETYGLPTRYITRDTGGWKHIQKYIDAGIMEVFAITDGTTSPMSLIRILQKGWWTPVDNSSGKPKLSSPAKNGLLDGKVGAYAVEGLTSISQHLMRHLTRTGRKVAQEVVGKWTEESYGDGDETFAAPAQSHYSTIQTEILGMIGAFAALPVKQVLFSAHEGKGQDSTTKATIFGPGVIGQAATEKVGPMVADMFHFETVTEGQSTIKSNDGSLTGKSNKQTVHAYYTKHPDAQSSSILWPAKARFPPELIDQLYTKFPGGFIDLSKSSIADYFRFRDSVISGSIDDILKWKSQIDSKLAAKPSETPA